MLLLVDIVMQSHTADANHRTLHRTISLQVSHHLFHDGRWDSKTIARERTRLRIQHRIDAHQFATRVHQRATRVTCIDGGIRLNERFNAVLVRTDATRLGRHDARRHRRGQVERIAYSQHPLTHFQLL